MNIGYKIAQQDTTISGKYANPTE